MSVPDRPAFDEAGIAVRPEGRQILISTGQVDDGDREHDREDVSFPLLERPSVLHVDPPYATGTAPTLDTGSRSGTRSEITGFSDRSRRRLRRKVHALDRDVNGHFVTLTYHETDPSPVEAKTHLDTFIKRLFRAFPEASVIWKMEPQERGVPHFHLLVYGIPYIPVQKWCLIWHQCTGETSDEHAQAGVDLEAHIQRDDGRLMAYLSKYMDKRVSLGDGWDSPGRFWGIRGRDRLPWADWEKVCTMSRAEAERVIYEMLDRWGVDLPEHTDIPQLVVDTRGDPAQAIGDLP